MTEESSLYNPGFLGSGGFHWWVGQISDDSTWRSNTKDQKFDGTSNIPGWGYRYKVRIIGLHDKEEETIPSDQLPWAQVMYPTTAGGGQSGSKATPNLRQGMFVFGFFLDGQEQEVPIIMGVLGNNAQTKLSKTIGDTKTNFSPTSGYAKGLNPDPKLKVADSYIKTDAKTFKEDSTAVHEQETASVKKNDLYTSFTIPLSSPCKKDNSDMTNIRVVIQNLTNDINKIQHALTSPIDAASKTVGNIKNLINNAANIISGYMKSIFDRIRGFVIKEFNKTVAPTIDKLFPNARQKFLEIKELAQEKLSCLFNKLISGLPALIGAFLNKSFGKYKDNPQTESEMIAPPSVGSIGSIGSAGKSSTVITAPEVIAFPPELKPVSEYENRPPQRKPIPICSVEALVGNILGNTLPQITNSLDESNAAVNGFLSDYLGNIAQSGGGIEAVNAAGASIQIRSSYLTNSNSSTTNKSFPSGISQITDSINKSIGGNSFKTANSILNENTFGLNNLIGGDIGELSRQSQILINQSSTSVDKVQQILGTAGSLANEVSVNLTSALSFIDSILSFFDCDNQPKCPQSTGYRFHDGSVGPGQEDKPNLANVAQAAEEGPDPAPKPPIETPFAQPRHDGVYIPSTGDLNQDAMGVTASGQIIDGAFSTSPTKVEKNSLNLF